MKKVITPATQEKAVYYSDFRGTCFEYAPAVDLTLNFNYSSVFDGAKLELHLTDTEALEIIEFLKSKLSKDCVNSLKQKIQDIDNRYDNAMEFRDWGMCESLVCSKKLLEKLVDIPEEIV